MREKTHDRLHVRPSDRADESGLPAVTGSAAAPRVPGRDLAGVGVGRSLAALAEQRFRVGPAGDVHEREADRLADSVVAGRRDTVTAGRADSTAIRRESGAGAPGSVSGGSGGVLDDATSGIIRRAGPGRPVDPDVSRQASTTLGQNLTDVRVHTGGTAARLASQLGATAFTTGRDVFFGQGRYEPETPDGRHLLAHELAHVAQGTGGGVIRRNTSVKERERSSAEAMRAHRFRRGEPVWWKGEPYLYEHSVGGEHDERVGLIAGGGSTAPTLVRRTDVEPITGRLAKDAANVLRDYVRVQPSSIGYAGDPVGTWPRAEEVFVKVRARDVDDRAQLSQRGLRVGELRPVGEREKEKRSTKLIAAPPKGYGFTWASTGQTIHRGEPMWFRGEVHRWAGEERGKKSVRLVNRSGKVKWVRQAETQPVAKTWVTRLTHAGKEKESGFIRVVDVPNEHRDDDTPPEQWSDPGLTRATLLRAEGGRTVEKLEHMRPAAGVFNQMLSFFADRAAERGEGSTLADANDKAADDGLEHDSPSAMAAIQLVADSSATVTDKYLSNPKEFQGAMMANVTSTAAGLAGGAASGVGAASDVMAIHAALKKGEMLPIDEMISLFANSTNVGVNVAGAGLGLASVMGSGAAADHMGAASTGLNGVADAFGIFGTLPGLLESIVADTSKLFGLVKAGHQERLETLGGIAKRQLPQLVGLVQSTLSSVRWICKAFETASEFTSVFPIIGDALAIASKLLDSLMTFIHYLWTLGKAIRREILHHQFQNKGGFRERSGAGSAADPAAAAQQPAAVFDSLDYEGAQLDAYTRKLLSTRHARSIETLAVDSTRLEANLVSIGASITAIVAVAGAAPSAGAASAMWIAAKGVSAGAAVTNAMAPKMREAIDHVVHTYKKGQKDRVETAAKRATTMTARMRAQPDPERLEHQLDYLDAVFDLSASDIRHLIGTGGSAGVRALQYHLFTTFWAIDTWHRI